MGLAEREWIWAEKGSTAGGVENANTLVLRRDLWCSASFEKRFSRPSSPYLTRRKIRVIMRTNVL